MIRKLDVVVRAIWAGAWVHARRPMTGRWWWLDIPDRIRAALWGLYVVLGPLLFVGIALSNAPNRRTVVVVTAIHGFFWLISVLLAYASGRDAIR